MAEEDGQIDGWWKIFHQDDSKMFCEEIQFPNPWLCEVAQGSFLPKCPLDIAFVIIGGTKTRALHSLAPVATLYIFAVHLRVRTHLVIEWS